MSEPTQSLNPDPSAATNVPAVEGQQNDAAKPNNTAALSLDEVNTLTGRQYANLDEAKKGIENLSSFVGKKEVVVEKAPAEVEQLKAQLAEMSFYQDNPELKEFKPFLSKFGNPSEAVKDPEVQKAITAIKASAETDSNRSVLNSNSRIVAPKTDDYQKDLEALRDGRLPAAEFMAKHNGIKME